MTTTAETPETQPQQPPQPPAEFEVGDGVVVVDNTCSHAYRPGRVYEITSRILRTNSRGRTAMEYRLDGGAWGFTLKADLSINRGKLLSALKVTIPEVELNYTETLKELMSVPAEANVDFVEEAEADLRRYQRKLLLCKPLLAQITAVTTTNNNNQ